MNLPLVVLNDLDLCLMELRCLFGVCDPDDLISRYALYAMYIPILRIQKKTWIVLEDDLPYKLNLRRDTWI